MVVVALQQQPRYTYNVLKFGADPTGTTECSTAFNAAYSAASGSTGGGRVTIPAGTYLIGYDTTPSSNIEIVGEGRASILQIEAGTTANVFALVSVSHILIKDVQINGNKANVTYTGGITYAHLQPIYILTSDDVTVENCYIHDGYSSGVMAKGSTNLNIRGNRLINCGDNQIYVRAIDIAPYTPCYYGTISNNICSDGSYSGIQILGSSYFAVTGNICYSNGPTSGQGDGVGSEGASHITIAGNVCYSNGAQGIQTRFTNEIGTTQKSSHITISGNECYGNLGTGGDNGGIGINDSDDVIVTGNLIYGNYYGININAGDGLGVTNVLIGENQVRGNTSYGIRAVPGNTTTIELADNFVDSNGADNLYATCRVVIQGGTYANAASSFHEGVHLDTGADSSVVQEASIYNNSDNGVLISGTCANVVVRDCNFNNVSGGTQGRALYESSGTGPTLMVNNSIANQATQPYYFSHIQSRYYDQQTQAQTTVTTNYSVAANDRVIFCNAASSITVTLPTAVNGAGRIVVIKDISGNASAHPITVATTGGQTIDGASSRPLEYAFGTLELITDGNNWYVIGLGQAQPWALYDGDPFNQSTNVLAANTAYLTGIYVPAYCTLTALRCRFGTGGNGHYDIGIYDVNGALLAHSGSTTSVTGTQTYTLPAPLNLAQGRYWLAFWIDNAVDTITKSNGNANFGVVQSGTSTTGLPASMSSLTGLGNTNVRAIVMGLIQGGWQ